MGTRPVKVLVVSVAILVCVNLSRVFSLLHFLPPNRIDVRQSRRKAEYRLRARCEVSKDLGSCSMPRCCKAIIVAQSLPTTCDDSGIIALAHLPLQFLARTHPL